MNQFLKTCTNKLLLNKFIIATSLPWHIFYYSIKDFDSQTGLNDARRIVSESKYFVENIPLVVLTSAEDFAEIKLAIVRIINYVLETKTLYPIKRKKQLIEAISKELNNQLLKVLSKQYLMVASFDVFEETIEACLAVFNVWKTAFGTTILKNNLLDMRVYDRLFLIRNFRRKHARVKIRWMSFFFV